MAVALIISRGSMVAHNLYELPFGLQDPENYGPLLIAAGLAAPAVAQQSPLTTARDLYASARYDEALIVLNSLRPNDNGSN